MKKIRSSIKAFISNHYKLAFFVTVILLFAAIIGVAYSLVDYSKVNWLLTVCFGLSIAAFLRLTTYKNGKMPFFMSDKAWDNYRLKYSGDELEQKYEEMSLNRATDYLTISIITFVIWVICEIFRLIFK